MSLKEDVTKQLATSMKEHDVPKTSAFRTILSKVIEFEKIGGHDVTHEDEQKIVRKISKELHEEIDSFKQFNRFEHLEEREKELAIVESFLPQQMSEIEIHNHVSNFLQTLDPTVTNPGRIIGMVMKELKGKADGNIVKQTVEKLVASKSTVGS